MRTILVLAAAFGLALMVTAFPSALEAADEELVNVSYEPPHPLINQAHPPPPAV
jgi:hypothetical protein